MQNWKQVHGVKSIPNYQPVTKITFFIEQFTVCRGRLPKARLEETKKADNIPNV